MNTRPTETDDPPPAVAAREPGGAHELPAMFRLRQRFPSHRVEDIEATVGDALQASGLAAKIRPGQRVAIAVGSRGISGLPRIVREVVRFLAAQRAEPVIVPAMGSHGGATARGQAALLASLGVDRDAMQCPVDASMDTVVAGTFADGVPVHFDAVCSRCDHVVLVNRVKPHTRLTGPLQSGLVKMLMIGLGKRDGASLYHQVFPRYDYHFASVAEQVVPILLREMPIALGLAIVEDAREQPARIEAVEPDDFLTREPELLSLAERWLARLPFDRADLLIIDRIGKEISGTGMDTNVVGRKANDKAAEESEWPKIRQIYVRSLSETTAGNASGIGIAEYCRGDVVRAMDPEATRINCLTSNHVTAAAIPMHFDSDAEVLAAAVTQRSGPAGEAPRWMWIPDTLHLGEVMCSQPYWDEAASREDLEVLAAPEPLRFDHAGNLVPR